MSSSQFSFLLDSPLLLLVFFLGGGGRGGGTCCYQLAKQAQVTLIFFYLYGPHIITLSHTCDRMLSEKEEKEQY